MRLWTISPKYLDTKGLVALWRETLLAKNVLLGNTKGYKNHPQLDRFKATEDPVGYIEQYLMDIYAESLLRGYNFNKDKINWDYKYIDLPTLEVSSGQIMYEFKHLLEKLYKRDIERYYLYANTDIIELHSLFNIYFENKIEAWEKVA